VYEKEEEEEESESEEELESHISEKKKVITVANNSPENMGEVLIDLGQLEEATVICRPSKSNKSPYVADCKVEGGRTAIVHCPSMDFGGKMPPGTKALVQKSKTYKEGVLGAHGKPKCEFIIKLIENKEAENKDIGGIWIGAHPYMGEDLAKIMLERNLLSPELPEVVSLEK